jgi:putative transposase
MVGFLVKELKLSAGIKAWLGSEEVTIKGPAGIDSVLIEEGDENVRTVTVALLSAGSPDENVFPNGPDLAAISQADWDGAREREQVIGPLAENPRRSVALMADAAAQLGCTVSFVYRLLARYMADPRTTTLIPHKRGKPRGLQMLSEDVERLMTVTIEEIYMNRQQVKVSDLAEEIRRRCRNAGLRSPGAMTVYRRIKALPPNSVLRARRGSKAAEDNYLPCTGNFPEVAWPLQVVQIDHTAVDAIVVDRVHRRPIGRPWLTLAIDIYSRMVAGFLLSLEPPSATSVALCVVQAATQKEDWLALRKIEAKWPIWGMPDTIHVDNGKEFHSEALTRGCAQYGIKLDYRPVRVPRYGGHIERLIGTIMGKVHLLPETTFSNIREKGDYDSEWRAVMTLPELEEWLAIGIGVYHSKIHSTLLMPPLVAWADYSPCDGMARSKG